MRMVDNKGGFVKSLREKVLEEGEIDMPNIVDDYREDFAKKGRMRHRFIACMVVLAVIVVIVVFYSLRMSGIAKVNDVSENIADFADGTADVEITTDWEATLPTADEMTGQFTDDLVLIAQSQLGYHESTLNFALSDDETTHYGYTRYGQWLGNPYQPTWDATFVAWCLNYAGLDEEQFPYNSGTYAWYVELSGDDDETDETDAEESYLTETPAVGELIFLDTTGDEKPDRMGIISAITESDESDSGETELTVITGDYDDCVCEVTYYAISPAIVTYVALPEPVDDAETLLYAAEVEDMDADVDLTAEETAEDITDVEDVAGDRGETIDLEVVSDGMHMLSGETATIADDDDAYAGSIVHNLVYPSNDAGDLPDAWKSAGYGVYTSSDGAVEGSSTKTKEGSYGFLIYLKGTDVSWGGWDDSANGVVIKTPIDNVLYDEAYKNDGTGNFYIPVSWCEEAYDFIFTADYAEDAQNGYCDFTYAPNADSASSNITRASYVCLTDGDTDYWYLKVNSTYSSKLARINLYYEPVTHPTRKNTEFSNLNYPNSSSSLPESWGLSVYASHAGATTASGVSGVYDKDGNQTYGFIIYYNDAAGKEVASNVGNWSNGTPVLSYVIDDVLTDGAGTYYIPVKRLEDVYGDYYFDLETYQYCEFEYAPDANNGSENKTPASYVCLKDDDTGIDYWYLQVESTFTGEPDRINLYYLGKKTVSTPEPSSSAGLYFWCYGAHWGENYEKSDGDGMTSFENYDPLEYKIGGYSEWWNESDKGESRTGENWSVESETYTSYSGEYAKYSEESNCDIGSGVEYYTYTVTCGEKVTTYYLVSIKYIEAVYSCDRSIDAGIYWQFDPKTTPYKECPFWYIDNTDSPNLCNADGQASYYSMDIDGDGTEEWFLRVNNISDTRMSLFYVLEYDDGFVLNLGNSNGTIADVDYDYGTYKEKDYKIDDDAMRYALCDNGGLYDFGDEDGMMTINLPSNSDLGGEFIYLDSSGGNTIDSTSQDGAYYTVPTATVVLRTSDPKKTAKELVGWVNIATGEYYDVSGGSTTATIDLSRDNVFYADWRATQESYNIEPVDSDIVVETADTSNFVSIEMFDYNNLVNLYSANVTQNGIFSESWADSGNLYDNFTMASDKNIVIEDGSFLFYDDIGANTGSILSNPVRPIARSLWKTPSTGFSWTYPMIADQVNALTPDDGILGILFDETESAVGVNYVGKANNLFTYDENGYYYYSSRQYAADYNKESESFTLYKGQQNIRENGKGDFFPYNAYRTDIGETDGTTNYWFGMKMETQFYLPDTVTAGKDDADAANMANMINGKKMTYEFAGDDDVWIFIDDTLVVDLTGVHDEIGCVIDFSTGDVECYCPTKVKVDENGTIDVTKEYAFSYNLLDLDAGIKPTDSNTDGYWASANIATVQASNEVHPLSLTDGDHTLTVYYLERGASLSNLTIKFNVLPKWNYDSLQVSQVTVDKEWLDGAGNKMNKEELVNSESDLIATVGLFEEIPEEGYVICNDNDGKGDYYEETITEGEGDNITTITNKYYIGDDGFARDEEGNIYGYYPLGAGLNALVLPEGCGENSFYLLVDSQELNYTNNWEYVWHTDSTAHNYIVLEYGNMTKGYQIKSITGGIVETDSDDYWTIIGEPDMEGATKGDTVSILITDAGSHYGTTDEGELPAALVVSHEDNNISIEKVEINAYPDGTTYGIIRNSDISDEYVWYMVYTGDSLRDDISNNPDPVFYICTGIAEDEDIYYLTEIGGTLTLTLEADSALTFVYSLAGELLVCPSAYTPGAEVTYSGRVIIDSDGKISLVESIAENGEEVENVRLYTLDKNAYREYAYTVENEQLAAGILPNTGGAGIITFACVGGGMVIIAAMWLVVRRRRTVA